MTETVRCRSIFGPARCELDAGHEGAHSNRGLWWQDDAPRPVSDRTLEGR